MSIMILNFLRKCIKKLLILKLYRKSLISIFLNFISFTNVINDIKFQSVPKTTSLTSLVKIGAS